MVKTHYLTEISDENNYILACGLKYKDSDNITFSKNKKEVTCKNCLILMKVLDKSYTTKELLDFLWKVVEKVKKHPELAPHHKFAKDYAKSVIVFGIIHALEKGELKMFLEDKTEPVKARRR